MKVTRKPSRLSGAGITIGLLPLAILWCIAIFGPGSYSGSGSGQLMADGTVVVTTQQQSVLPLIAQTAFLALVAPLVLGIAGVFRKESLRLSLASIALGFAPVPIYTIGVFFVPFLYLGAALVAAGVMALRRRLA